MIAWFKKFPHKATCVLGVVYLATWFLVALKPTTLEILLFPVLIYFFVNAVSSFITIAVNWTSPYSVEVQRHIRSLLLCTIFLGLTIPVARLGHYLKIQIFLMELPRYQELVDGIIEKEKTRPIGEGTMIPVPKAFSDLCPYWIIFEDEGKNVITVDFMTDDYGFPPRHGGYIYISNSHPSSLKEIRYRDYSFVQLASNWYRWSD